MANKRTIATPPGQPTVHRAFRKADNDQFAIDQAALPAKQAEALKRELQAEVKLRTGLCHISIKLLSKLYSLSGETDEELEYVKRCHDNYAQKVALLESGGDNTVDVKDGWPE